MARTSNAVKEFGENIATREIKFLITEDDFFSLQFVAAVNRQTVSQYVSSMRDNLMTEPRKAFAAMQTSDGKPVTSQAKTRTRTKANASQTAK